MTTPIRPDTSLYGPARPLSRPDTALYGPPRAISSDASRMAGSSGTGKMTWEQAMRAAAAGVLPGISDEVIGFLRAAKNKGKPFAELFADAVGDERRILDEARTMAGSGVLENLSALASGIGLTKLATKGVPVVSKVADFLVGGVGKGGAPSSLLGGVGQGAKAGARVGAIAGAGNADDGSALDRIFGGAIGAVAGGTVGGLAGGTLTAAANRVAPAQLNAADAAQVFAPGTPVKAQRQAIGALSDAQRDAGVSEEAARRAAAALGPEGVYADVGGVKVLNAVKDMDALSQTRGGEAGRIAKERLAPRAQERPARRADAIPAATGRPTPSFPDYIDKLKAQKSALDDIMFGRFRQAAEAKGPTRVARLRTPDQLKKTLKDPKFFNAAVKLEEEMVSNEAAGVAGRYISPFKPVLDGDGVPTGEFEVKDFLDPVTLSELSRVLGGMREEAYAVAGNARLARAPAAAKQQIDDLLSTIPEFKEANALSKHMHTRIKAAEEGYQRGVGGKEGALTKAKRVYSQPAPPIPRDVQKILAGPDAPPELAGRRSLGPAWSDFEAGAQSARVDPLVLGRNPKVVPSRDATLFGPDAAAKIQAADEAEAIMARTELASPTTQNRVAPSRGMTPEQQAVDLGTLAARDLTRFGGTAKGLLLGGVDIARSLGRYGVPASPERMATMMQGAMGAPTPTLNLIDQLRAASNTPMRRGLLGGSGYAAGGLFGDNRNQ